MNDEQFIAECKAIIELKRKFGSHNAISKRLERSIDIIGEKDYALAEMNNAFDSVSGLLWGEKHENDELKKQLSQIREELKNQFGEGTIEYKSPEEIHNRMIDFLVWLDKKLSEDKDGTKRKW